MPSRIPSALVLSIAAFTASADDGAKAAADRKAKVALALASAGKPAIAPAPRSAPFPSYSAGYKTALTEGKPLVVYVGCAGKHPVNRVEGAVVAVAPDLTGYESGTIVVCYPAGKSVLVHATLDCSDHGAPVEAAVKEAVKKVAAPPAKAERSAPAPLEWTH